MSESRHKQPIMMMQKYTHETRALYDPLEAKAFRVKKARDLVEISGIIHVEYLCSVFWVMTAFGAPKSTELIDVILNALVEEIK